MKKVIKSYKKVIKKFYSKSQGQFFFGKKCQKKNFQKKKFRKNFSSSKSKSKSRSKSKVKRSTGSLCLFYCDVISMAVRLPYTTTFVIHELIFRSSYICWQKHCNNVTCLLTVTIHSLFCLEHSVYFWNCWYACLSAFSTI